MTEPLGLATHWVVALEATCPNQCSLCAEPPVDAGLGGSWRASLEAGRPTHERLVLAGPEPLAAATLDEAITLGHALGYASIEVMTNGRLLAERARSLATAGVRRVQLTLHGARAAVHDYHTGRPGSFDAADAGLRAALDAKLPVEVATALTRSSYRTLADLPAYLRARGVTRWTVFAPHAAGRAATDFDRTLPRLGLAVPFALHAAELAAKLGIETRLADVPLCLLGPHAARAIPRDASARRALPEVCASCAAADVCSGLDPRYAARFEGDELRPRSDRPALTGSPYVRPRLLEVTLPTEVPEGPRAARRRLPVLGRAMPGAAERRGPSKSGEALREILPALFEPEEPA